MAKNTPQPGVPWSIFQQGGGQGAAATWADDALREIGAPVSQPNEQVVYDWEVSEGSGGWYNPLNQGPDPNHANYTSSGAQYGGGAANYTSYNTGLKGFKDYMNMPAYSAIRSDLRSNADYATSVSDIVNSPWASSHYGGGSGFSGAGFPGKKSVLKGGSQPGPIQAQTTSFISGLSGLNTFLTDLSSADLWERAALVIFGAGLILIGILVLALPGVSRGVSMAGSAARQVSAVESAVSNVSGPTADEREDRSRRLALAERNAAIGEKKVNTQALKEERLSLGNNAKRRKAQAAKHASGTEPNPNPPHS